MKKYVNKGEESNDNEGQESCVFDFMLEQSKRRLRANIEEMRIIRQYKARYVHLVKSKNTQAKSPHDTV